MCQTIFRKVNSTWKKQFAPQNTRNHANGAEPNNDPGFTVRVKARPGQGCSKVGPGHSKPETRGPKAERNPKTEVRIDSHPGEAAANRIRPFSKF